ncbi:MAG: hypothetical protein J5501_02730 [Ruminococcus sp.]|nr:hypothetical protein [Ruminococcus sp.]
MIRRFQEWYSMQRAKRPALMIVFGIAIFNIVFFFIAALIIRSLALSGTESMSLFEALYYTLTMILDAGCISYVINDIGTSGVAIALVCIAVVIIGMITFTGAIIGTMTNAFSGSIEKTQSGSRKLYTSGHLVILNWNSRASEIINDLLYCGVKKRVVVLTDSRKEEIEKEISDRISDTIARENTLLRQRLSCYSGIKFHLLYRKERMKNLLYILVREGDVFSTKQLRDISIEKAEAVMILGADINNSVCKYQQKSRQEEHSRGNAQTVKTLMQVSDITGADDSNDDQKIIVEISDDWTAELVRRIVKNKKQQQDNDKNTIVSVRVNQILGQLLSQFSLMPELNLAYQDLFSNKGATFQAAVWPEEERNAYLSKAGQLPGGEDSVRTELLAERLYIDDYLEKHRRAIPLGSMAHTVTDGQTGEVRVQHFFYFSAGSEADIHTSETVSSEPVSLKINRSYWIDKKRVIILGHNDGIGDIMKGFEAFCGEWDPDGSRHILEIVVIDDQEHLDKAGLYKQYPFVIGTRAATIYDKDIICETIDWFMDFAEDEEKGDVSILILSDDSAPNDDIDANVLANLVYVQDIIADKKAADPDFDTESIDVIVELINPKHHDIVSRYSVTPDTPEHDSARKYCTQNTNNVVISNRYISKMVTQIGEKKAIYDFYTDILTYDEAGAEVYRSKEVYAKKASSFFEELPPECTEAQLIRAVWSATKNWHPTVVLGYVKPGGYVRLFCGDQTAQTVKLGPNDKLIVFTDH